MKTSNWKARVNREGNFSIFHHLFDIIGNFGSGLHRKDFRIFFSILSNFVNIASDEAMSSNFDVVNSIYVCMSFVK